MFALHVGHDGTDGYVVYKVKHDWPHGFSRSVLEVRRLDATTPGAYADLWRYVLDVDLVETGGAGNAGWGGVVWEGARGREGGAWNRPLDEPLLYLLQDPRRIRPTIIDNLWVRLLRLPAAPAAPRGARAGR